MVDKYADAALGEVISKAEERKTTVVEYAGTISAGDALKISGVNTDGQPKVVQAAAGDMAHYVAMFAGVSGDFKEVLVEGIVKITYGGAVAIGAAVKAGAAGKFVAAVRTVTIPAGATAVTSTSANPSMTVEAGIACGTSLHDPAADGDTGLIHFRGGP